MTVVRRELPLSRSASRPWTESGRRIAQARALQSCPHRRAGDSLEEAHVRDCRSGREHSRCLRHGSPDESRELARYCGDRDGWTFAVADEVSIATMQALLRAPGLGHDGRGLVGGMTSQPVAEGRPMAIVPGG